MSLLIRLVLLAVLLPMTAQAEGLFRDVPAAQAAALDDPGPQSRFPATVKRRRLAILDSVYLAERVLPDVPMAVGIKPVGKALGVELPLFPDLTLTLVGRQTEQTAVGRMIWTGYVAGSPESSAILVVNGTTVTGQIFHGPLVIEIRLVAGDVHAIVEINADAFPDRDHVVGDPAQPSPDARPTEPPPASHPGPFSPAPASPIPDTRAETAPLPPTPAATTTTLNIFVAYTAAAAAASSDIVSEIVLTVASANTAYTNSGINAQLSLVGTGAMTGYTEGTYTTSSSILSAFTTNSDGVMDTIHTLRTANSADLVALIVENLYDACGIAWLYTGKPESGFSVTQRSCATGNLSFVHEIGHNLGATHDRYVSTGPSNTYNYGYVDTTNRVRTVMAYADQCTAAGISCTRLPYFSSPDLTYQGRALGVARSASGSADNVRRHNETVTAVGRFRSGTSTALPEKGWWWSSTEAGRGYSLEVSGSTIFFAFYSYASNGTPVWYVSSAVMTSANRYYAAMQQYQGGQTLNGSYQAASVASTPGWVDISFSSDRTGTIYFWTSDTGWSAGSAITRFDFITNGAAVGTASGYPQTGWWWNASEPGRGFFIEAQDSAMFVSFYLYNSTGQATWYVASGYMVSSTLFTGTISEYSGGSVFTASTYTAPTSSTTQGTISIQFGSQTTATMTMPNGTQVALTRFAF